MKIPRRSRTGPARAARGALATLAALAAALPLLVAPCRAGAATGRVAGPGPLDPLVLGIVRQVRDSTARHDSLEAGAFLPLPADTDEYIPGGSNTDWRSEYFRRLRQRQRHHHDLVPVGDYNRVDQLRLGLRGSLLPSEPFYPRAELEASYSLGRGQWNYEASLEQPLLLRPYLAAGGRLYRMTDSPDWDLLSRAENTLSTAMLRQDYLDYFGRRGASVFARVEWEGSSQLRVDYRADDLSALAALRSTWSLFGGERPFRANPAYTAGHLHQLSAELQLSSRSGQAAPRPGLDLTLQAVGAGGGLGGDLGFSRVRAESRWTSKLAPGLWLNVRAAAGAALSDSLPTEYQFSVGGVGTLRGHEYKEQQGDRFYLLNVEYALNIGQHVAVLDRDESLRGLELVLFLESGRAWHRGPSADVPSAWDAGLGVQTSGDGFHLYLAQDLDADHAGGPKVSFRLSRTF